MGKSGRPHGDGEEGGGGKKRLQHGRISRLAAMTARE
jgi:hypothetical protein